MLSVEGVSKVYGRGGRRRSAVSDCSFACSAGEILGVIGPNGAGKTTLLRLISGETTPTTGTITVGGYPQGTRMARRAVGYAGDPPLLPSELSGVEWLKYVAGHRARHPRERTSLLQWAIEIADLEEFAGRRISSYSKGMVQRLALATAALAGSSALILDEVLSGLDPIVARRLSGTIQKLATMGRSVVIASHDLSILERLATRVLVMCEGRLAEDLSVARLVGERVAELTIAGAGIASIDRLLARFSGATRTEDGVEIPLTRGVTVEHAIAACRSERIPLAASRIRYRALEDMLLKAAASNRDQQPAA